MGPVRIPQRGREARIKGASVVRSGIVLVRDIAADEVRGHVTAELHAGVGARQGPACDAADVANSNVFDRRRLPGRKIGRLCGRDGDDAGRGTEQKALDERHFSTSSYVLGVGSLPTFDFRGPLADRMYRRRLAPSSRLTS